MQDNDIHPLREVAMTKVKMTENGSIVLPKAVRDRRGFSPGTEFEVIDGGLEIVLKPVEGDRIGQGIESMTLEQFLARRIPYNGPQMTDEMIRAAVDQAAIEDWARLERQWNDDKGN
jgi:AbrB family looped-hinge helix DNA binding protein